MSERKYSEIYSNSSHEKVTPGIIQKVKVVTVGDISVGKSSLAMRFTKGIFEDQYKPTVGAVFVFRTVNYGRRRVLFQIWDTAGQERFKSLVPMYLRDAKFVLLVYDITDMKSFEAVPYWLNYVTKYAPADIQIALVANKIDLNHMQSVDSQVAQQFAQENGAIFEEVSAKKGTNVENLFTRLAMTLPVEEPEKSTPKKKKIPVNPKLYVNDADRISFGKCCTIR